jgi:LEA14-like dessication related protein
MTKISKLLLVAGAGLAAWYVPTILAVLNMEVSILSVIPTGFYDTRIDFLVTVKIKNSSMFRVNMQDIKADILLNGLKIAQFQQAQTLMLLPNSEQNFNVSFSIDAETVGSEIYQQLVARNLQNFVLDVKGSLTANNKVLPFDSVWTVADLKQ